MATPKNRWLNLLFRVSGKLPLRVISTRGETPEPYLERYSILRSRWLTIYLHRFVRRDQDHELHDHPWSAISLVLAGSYRERRINKQMGFYEHTVRWMNIVRPEQFHMIVDAEPETWTLFVHGRKRKAWGFLSGLADGQASYVMAPAADPDWHRSDVRPERKPLGSNAGGSWFVQTKEK